MSVYETLPVQDSGVHIHQGVFARDVPDLVTMAYVLLPNFDHGLQFGPCMWQPRGPIPPKRGDDCLVLLDNSQQPWVTAWWPKIPDPIYPLQPTGIPILEGSKLNFHVGSSPPGSPTDGMLWICNGIAGIYWLFIFDSTEAIYKWKCVGGPPALARVDADQTAGTANTWIDLATDGPLITVPRAGEYVCEAKAIGGSTTSSDRLLIGIATTGGTPGRYGESGIASTTVGNAEAVDDLITATTINYPIKVRYQTVGSTTGHYYNRSLLVRPVRVI